MKRILISVEGQTEETFIKNVLAPFLLEQEILISPKLVMTKRVKSGPNFKGGLTSYGQAQRDLRHLLKSGKPDLLTTMYDYYGLPTDFPGFNQLPNTNTYAKVQYLEDCLSEDINSPAFIPFLMVHEFEAFGFINPNITIRHFPNSLDKLPQLQKITSDFNNPEEINNSPQTAPSKRLIALFPDYSKPRHGAAISSELTVPVIMEKCPHFTEWIEKLLNF